MSITSVPQQALAAVEAQQGLDSLGDTVQTAVEGLFAAAGPAGNKIEQALHGAPAGHPLHPAIVAIPIGAWTVTQIGDLLEAISGDERLATMADGALVIGLLGALAAGATGVTDWKDTDGGPRRLGLTHGLLNMGATALYAWSLRLRQKRARKAGRTVALAGYGLVMLSGFIGGELVFKHRIGTNHAGDADSPETFQAVLNAAELGEGELRQVEIDGEPVVLARQDGHIYAMAGHCAHLGAELAEGKLEAGSLRCPWHGSLFRLEDGAVLEGPSAFAQPCFAVRVRQGQIEIRAADSAALQNGVEKAAGFLTSAD